MCKRERERERKKERERKEDFDIEALTTWREIERDLSTQRQRKMQRGWGMVPGGLGYNATCETWQGACLRRRR